MRPFLLLATCILSLSPAAIADKPKVLLLGDSISIGYTPHVQKLLKADATVTRPMQKDGKRAENCAYAANGITRLDTWLGDTKWDVIHFNFGLHDLKYIGQALPNAKIVSKVGDAIKKDPKAHQLSTPEEYAANLEKIVKRLKKTGAVLIFCQTTPVPEGSRGRLPGDSITFNKAADPVMIKHGVLINELHPYALTDKVAATQRKADVHYTQEGSALLAEQVVRAIKAALEKK